MRKEGFGFRLVVVGEKKERKKGESMETSNLCVIIFERRNKHNKRQTVITVVLNFPFVQKILHSSIHSFIRIASQLSKMGFIFKAVSFLGGWVALAVLALCVSAG